MSEWLIVVKRQFSNFSAISWREQINFQWDDDEVRFVLDQHAELDLYSASSLKQQSVGRHVAPLWHVILIPSQPVFAQYKFSSLSWFFCLNQLKLFYCLNKAFFSHSFVFSHWLQLLCQSALPYKMKIICKKWATCKNKQGNFNFALESRDFS